jgi:hypothetical protein
MIQLISMQSLTRRLNMQIRKAGVKGAAFLMAGLLCSACHSGPTGAESSRPGPTQSQGSSSGAQGGGANQPGAPAPGQTGTAPDPESHPAGAGKSPSPEYRFLPVDLTTAVGNTPLQVWINPRGANLTAAQLSAVSSRIVLRTWPELAPVAVDTHVREANPAGDIYARVFVTPRTPLSDRWYVLQLSAKVDGIQAADDPANDTVLPDGSHAARFRVGKGPVLVSVRQHEKTPGKFSVTFDFSEQLEPDDANPASAAVLSDARGRARACTGRSLTSGSALRGLGFTCDEEVLQVDSTVGLRRLGQIKGNPALNATSRSLRAGDVLTLRDGSKYVKFAPETPQP